MSDKQIYELTVNDLARSGVWFFPMDDSVEDELTVRPLAGKENSSDFQIIVSTDFFGASGTVYAGYLYWNSNAAVEYVQPVVLSEKGEAVSFWNGMIKPSWECSKFSKVVRADLPISYVSKALFGLPLIRGRLEGIYYLVEGQVCCCS